MPAAKLPLPLRRAQRRLDLWRRNRGNQWKIPEELWGLAARLGSEHGVSRACHALRLNYSKLKRLVADYEAGHVTPEPTPERMDVEETEAERGSDASSVEHDASVGLADSADSPTVRGACRAEKMPVGPLAGSEPELPAFFELLPPSSIPPECQVELEDAYGKKMQLHLKGRIPDLLQLARLFFHGGEP